MRTQSSPGSCGLAVSLLVLLAALLVTQTGCNHYPPPVQARAADMAKSAAVEIITECGTGSGVLVDERHVVTANHVVWCDDREAVSRTLAVELDNGRVMNAHVDARDPDKDLARMVLDVPVAGVMPVKVAHAKLGGTACIYAAHPERAVKCNTVTGVGEERKLGDVVTKHDDIWFGNSGSGVYDADGNLIGIAVRLAFCSAEDAFAWQMLGVKPKKTCGGRVSSLDDSRVMP